MSFIAVVKENDLDIELVTSCCRYSTKMKRTREEIRLLQNKGSISIFRSSRRNCCFTEIEEEKHVVTAVAEEDKDQDLSDLDLLRRFVAYLFSRSWSK